jgi:hypothetical protein
MNKFISNKGVYNLKHNYKSLFQVIVKNERKLAHEKILDLLNHQDDYVNSSREISPPDLIISEDKKYDFANGMLLYDAFKDLNLTILTDERFWVTLLLHKYFDYVIVRWKTEHERTLHYHWFYYENSRRSISYHAIARLFWRVKVSIDEENKIDKFFYTKFVFSIPEIMKNAMFRGFIYHDSSRLGYLDAMYEISTKKKIKVDDIYKVTKIITNLRSASILDYFSRKEIKDMILDEFYK